MITDIDGIRVGHWTDLAARTGCTVVRLPEGTVAAGEVRGGAPATREFALLAPDAMMQRVDAVVLAGGSAFGLSAADGVMTVLEAEGVGYPTVAGPVPIVVAMSIFDLGVGDPSVRPGPEQGATACRGASDGPFEVGQVGVGTGATTAKWRGPEHRRRGGLVTQTARHDGLVVSALVAVNAFGEIGADPASVIEGTVEGAFSNTTIGVVATNARLDKSECLRVAQGAHDGLARAVSPSHTAADGDAFVAAATAVVDAPVERVRVLAAEIVERAILTLADQPLEAERGPEGDR